MKKICPKNNLRNSPFKSKNNFSRWSVLNLIKHLLQNSWDQYKNSTKFLVANNTFAQLQRQAKKIICEMERFWSLAFSDLCYSIIQWKNCFWPCQVKSQGQRFYIFFSWKIDVRFNSLQSVQVLWQLRKKRLISLYRWYVIKF